MSNWKLQRKDDNSIIELPQDLYWSDEFDWSDLAQSNPVYTLAGSVILQQGTKQAARPITLTGTWVWLQRDDYAALQSWSAVPELEMTLTHYDSRVFNVCFRNHEQAIACEPVVYRTPETPSDQYTGSINLMTI